MKKIKKYLIEKLTENAVAWGVECERKIPPEFIICEHALERLKERFYCEEKKLYKIVVKAWNNKEKVPFGKIIKLKNSKSHKGNISYKTFNGFIFVFANYYNSILGFNQKTLVTVYNPKVVND